MPNIHAINAQGTEYGIEADNGITQAQAEKIATIGNASNLSTDAKTTLVAAINEVYGKTVAGAVVYENSSPSSSQGTKSIAVSGLTNAKALKITYGKYEGESGALKEGVFPLQPDALNEIYLSQMYYDPSDNSLHAYSRVVSINAARTVINIAHGQNFIYSVSQDTGGAVVSASSTKVIKIIALF